MKMGRGFTVDSGAAGNVMPRRMVRGKSSKIRPSPGSLAGVHYMAATNARIKNKGEAECNFTTNEGQDEAWVFQVVAVDKVLCAVLYFADRGNLRNRRQDRRRHVTHPQQEDREDHKDEEGEERVDDRCLHR